ncbi:MAG: alpha-N-acetylglucosaminidase [Acidobacteriaceae bacterium]
MLSLRPFRRASLLLALTLPAAAQAPKPAPTPTSVAPAEAVLHRIMPHLAPQFHLTLHPDQPDAFRITGTPGSIHVEAATIPTLLYGVNWYLKYVAHLNVSTNGLQLGPPNLTLPAPSTPIEKPALYKVRYALNENVDGYAGPYWSDARWQHEIDILALSGTNAILIERGADLVLYQTFRDAGYSDLAIRNWITQPAHQNWQLMGNMCCFDEPISLDLLHKRAASAKKIIDSLRALGITPVLPGYYGIVPADFATLHPGAHVITQGDWNGFTRPGWLDPRDPGFAILAASFYRHQRDLFGDTSIYDMEIFQEGGTTGNVPPGPAAQLVQKALETAHPNALWFMMAWQSNPLPAIIDAVDTSHVLIADIEQGRIARNNRDKQFHGADWLFGGLWEFGGRTTLGAPLYDYAVRFPKMAALPDSHIVGTALFTEGLDTNPYAFDLYTEMAWHKDPVDLDTWTNDYALRRYGSPTHNDTPDPHAVHAWQILLHTAYGYRAGDGTAHGPGDADAPQGSLFNAQPSLTTTHAGSWAPSAAHYPLAALQPALTELLQVSPSLRHTETYQFDLVDIARQVMANQSRVMLPEINAAYVTHDHEAFRALTRHWMRDMQLQNTLLATNQYFLLGRWLSYVSPWSSSPAELKQLNYDARSILTTWGNRKASEAGLHEYANRDYAGLTSTYYAPRWQLYFHSLQTAMDTNTTPKPIDWYAFGDNWNRRMTTYNPNPTGNSYAAATAIANDLNLAPPQSSKP